MEKLISRSILYKGFFKIIFLFFFFTTSQECRALQGTTQEKLDKSTAFSEFLTKSWNQLEKFKTFKSVFESFKTQKFYEAFKNLIKDHEEYFINHLHEIQNFQDIPTKELQKFIANEEKKLNKLQEEIKKNKDCGELSETEFKKLKDYILSFGNFSYFYDQELLYHIATTEGSDHRNMRFLTIAQ